MKIARVKMKSLSPYSQSRAHAEPKLDGEKESADDYERRTWRARCHTTPEGKIYIPPMAFKHALSEAAAYLSEKIPGKRNATWTKHFLAGVLVTKGPVLDITKDEVEGEWVYAHANGQRGSGTRVMRCFPIIPQWEAEVTFVILDELINRDAFTRHIQEAGNFIGIGRFRPRNGGFLGRFSADVVEWKDKVSTDEVRDLAA